MDDEILLRFDEAYNLLVVKDLDDECEVFEVHLLDLLITILTIHNLIKQSFSQRGWHFLFQVLNAPKHLTQSVDLGILGILKNNLLKNA